MASDEDSVRAFFRPAILTLGFVGLDQYLKTKETVLAKYSRYALTDSRLIRMKKVSSSKPVYEALELADIRLRKKGGISQPKFLSLFSAIVIFVLIVLIASAVLLALQGGLSFNVFLTLIFVATLGGMQFYYYRLYSKNTYSVESDYLSHPWIIITLGQQKGIDFVNKLMGVSGE